MTRYVSPAEQARRAQLRQGRSPDAQLARQEQRDAAVRDRQRRAIREQLKLQQKQGANARARVGQDIAAKVRR